MEIIRLGPTTLNLDYLIATDEDPTDPGTLLVESVTGTIRKVRGAHAEKLRRRLDELDPPPPKGKEPPAGRPRKPRVTVYDETPAEKPSRPPRGRRRG